MPSQAFNHGDIDLALRARALPMWASPTAKISLTAPKSQSPMGIVLRLENESMPETMGLNAFADREGRRRELTKYLIEEGMTAAARWRASGLEIPVAIEIGESDVEDETLLLTLRLVMQKTRLRPGAFSLMVPSEAYLAARVRATRALRPIADDGIPLYLSVDLEKSKTFEPLTNHPFTAFHATGTRLWDHLRLSGPGEIGPIGYWFAWAQVHGMPRLASGLSSFRDVGVARAFGFNLGQGRHIGGAIPASSVMEELGLSQARVRA